MKLTKRILKPMLRVVTAISPSCRDVVALKSSANQGGSRWMQRFGVRVHLALCQWCRRYEKQLHFLREAAHQCDQVTLEKTLSPEARQRLKYKPDHLQGQDHHDAALND
jgi:hypothetical protein